MNKTLIIGELIFDNHYVLKKIGKSLETNTPKYQIVSKTLNLGGAGFVYKILNKINKKNLFFLTKNNKNQYLNLEENIITINNNENNIIKNRYWYKNKKIFQFNEDNLKKTKFGKNILNKLKLVLKKNNFNKIIVSDYNHGVVTPKLVNFICNYCKENNVILFVDTQIRSVKEIKNFKYVDYFFMNTQEAALYKKKYNLKNIKELIHLKNIKNIILKKGKLGVTMLGTNQLHIRGLKGKKVIDEAGAGDTLLAFFSHLIDKKNINLVLKKSNKEAYRVITERKSYVR